MNCPHCKKSDMTSVFAKMTEKVREWICDRCGLTWMVEDE